MKSGIRNNNGMPQSGMTIHFKRPEPASDKDGILTETMDEAIDYSPLPRLTRASCFMGVVVSVGGMIFGYDTGQISGFVNMPDFLERFGELGSDGEYSFSATREGLIVGLLSIGTLIGSLAAAPLSDFFGRRKSISAWTVVVAAAFVIQISANHWVQIMMGRFVAGLGVGALSLLVPMYQAETAPPWIRGALVCTYQLMITGGQLLASIFNYATYSEQKDNSGSWRIVLGIGWLWCLILGVGILFFPESPRYDYRHGHVERATRTLCKVYGAGPDHYAIRTQLEEIRSKLEEEELTKTNENFVSEMVRMFRAPRMAYRIALGMSLQAFQQLTGANYFFYYGTTIFQSVAISSFVTQIILTGINFGATFVGLYLIEHCGRRKSLIWGGFWMFVCFMIFSSVGHFALDIENPAATPGPGIALIIFASLFVLGYASTWGPMVWTMQAELFPSRYRAKGMGMSTASNWLWNFLIAFFTEFITEDIDFMFGYVFAGCNLLMALVVYFFVIEGRGRSLEEIDTMYVTHVPPTKSASWVPPATDANGLGVGGDGDTSSDESKKAASSPEPETERIECV